MDAYDAILEQLKRAQRRGLEAVTNRLDFVVESLEELVAEARSSVKEAIPKEAEELFPLAEIGVALDEARRQAAAAGSAAVEPTAQIVTLELLVRLDQARSQSELLRELLPLLTQHSGRAAVLVLRGRGISAWSGIGFDDGSRLREWQADVDGSPILTAFADEGRALRFAPLTDPVVGAWLQGEDEGTDALLLPVTLRGKLVGGLYVDRVEGRPWNPEAVQVLLALTCWLIDTLPQRPTTPSPLVADVVDLRPAVGATPAAFSASASVEATAEPDPTVAVGGEETGPAEEIEEIEETREVVEEAEFIEPAEEIEEIEEIEEASEAAEETPQGVAADEASAFDPSATMRVEDTYERPAPVMAVEADEEAEEPEQAAVVPPPVRPVVPPTPDAGGAAPSADDARHEEARRFARLLVSEIKLYNEDEVDRGRANGDLYQRLKEDIDRSREMFDKRIPAEIREIRDYFHDELVRILADGDANALGM